MRIMTYPFSATQLGILLILMFNSCIQESEPLEDISKVSVKEARAFYENNRDKETTPSGRSENSVYHNSQLDWEKGYYRNRRNGSVLIIPITFEKDLFVVSSETGLKFPVENRIYGFVYRERNQLHFEIFHWVPTENNLNFTGYLMVSDIHGKTKRYYLYENGEFVKELAVDENDTNDGGRVEVTFIETCYYTCTVRSSGPDECYLDYCRIEAVSEPATLASPGGPDTGGGGEGGSENGMCPHPYISGKWVDCEDICTSGSCCAMGLKDWDCINQIPDCYGNPLKSMEIASSGASGKNGGRDGCVRIGSGCTGNTTKKYHDGLDLKATPGSFVFSAFPGRVTDIRKTFSPGKEKDGSYGNYVTIESIKEGITFRLKYNHLDYVWVSVGQNVTAGTVIGIAGTTGNAASEKVKEKHVHVQAFKKINSNFSSANPENYMTTKFDNNGNSIANPCNN